MPEVFFGLVIALSYAPYIPIRHGHRIKRLLLWAYAPLKSYLAMEHG